MDCGRCVAWWWKSGGEEEVTLIGRSGVVRKFEVGG